MQHNNIYDDVDSQLTAIIAESIVLTSIRSKYLQELHQLRAKYEPTIANLVSNLIATS